MFFDTWLKLRNAGVLGLNARNRAVMAAKARAHVLENFTVARMQDQTLAVYREVLEAG